MGKEEEYFPRGGSTAATPLNQQNGDGPPKKGKKRGSVDKEFVKRPKSAVSSDPALTGTNISQDDLLFIASRKKMKKKTKKNRVTGEDLSYLKGGLERKQQDKDFLVDTLTYESMCEGILSLGKVIQVRDHEIMVSLPGRTLGSVPITSISTQYTKALEKSTAGQLGAEESVYGISEMFKPGQVVIVKVTSVIRGDSMCRVLLSMKPDDIHSNYTSLQFTEKMVCMAAVESHEDHGYVMSFGVKSVRAFLPTSGAKSYVKNQNYGRPLGIGQIVPCKITHIKFHRLIANVTLTAEAKEVRNQGMPDGIVNYSTLLPGMLVKTTVLNAHKTGIKVYFLDLGGLIHQDHMQDMWFNPLNNELGNEVVSRVLYIMPNGTRPYLSLHPKLMPGTVCTPSSSIKLGGEYKVTIVRYEKRGLIIRFSSNEKGIVTPQRCSDDLSYSEENLIADFPAGSSHNCRVLAYSAMDNVYIAAFQQSVLNESYINIEELNLGDIVDCQLQSWNNGGALVNMGRVKGFIPTNHFAVVPGRDPRIKYSVGLKLKARIFKLDVLNSKVFLTARKPLLKSKGPLIATYEEAVPLQISDGVVHSINAAGLLVSTMGGLLGFVPKSKVSSEPIHNLADHYALGQVVKFKVLQVKAQAKKLILTLDFDYEAEMNNNKITEPEKPKKDKKKKSSDVGDDTVDENASDGKYVRIRKNDSDGENQSAKKTKKRKTSVDSDDQLAVETSNRSSKKAKRLSIINGVSESETNGKTTGTLEKGGNIQSKLKRKAEEPIRKKQKKRKSAETEEVEEMIEQEPEVDVNPLPLESPSKSFWDISEILKDVVEDEPESGGSDEENDETPSSGTSDKKKKLNKRTQDKLKEAALRSAELALADPDRKPESVEQFDCLVMGSPNSSLCWIQYMSFYLDSANIEMARLIGERALKTIVFNEEQERLNVWVALLNLENSFGTDESVKNVFQNARRNCDAYKISIQMCDIYTSSKKTYEAEKILTNMLKTFKSDLNVWVRLGTLHYRNNNVGLGRKQFNSALDAVPPKDHIALITKFANLEFEHGDEGKARTMMDQTLATHPKRLDLYLSFAKIHIKHKDYDNARGVYERAIGAGFPPRKAKTLFAQYLEFENEHGDATTRAKVGQLAVEYVQGIQSI